MQVKKRNGDLEEVSFDKVLVRLKRLASGAGCGRPPLHNVNIHELAQKVCSRIFDGVETSQLDKLAANMCSSLMIEHLDYGEMAARIMISNHHKNTSPSFSETIKLLYEDGIVTQKLYDLTMLHSSKLNTYIDYSRDYLIDYFGFVTLERSYLFRDKNDRVVERFQDLVMRVALSIHHDDLKDVLHTYDLISLKYCIHATPTLFNSGTHNPQKSSCFLLPMQEDSITGIFDTLKECAMISKYAGGIGMSLHNIRCENSYIKGTNGRSSGIVPMLRVFNNMAQYVNQAGRRNGSIAVYLETWHGDIEKFLYMKKNHGAEEERARDLFYALWVSDLFMKRVKEDAMWSLFCPNTAKGLCDVYGDEFERLYTAYEAKGVYVKQVKAQDLWFKILESQIETGTPYIGYKDHVNRKTNQSNLGIIKSSNLCMEICEVSTPDEVAVCNLASICLVSHVVDGEFDFERLHATTKVLVKNLNKVIDDNFYPLEKAEKSNKAHRPIGIGIQGLADAFAVLKMPFDSAEAMELDRRIFETMYHGAVEASMELSKKYGPYSSFEGSPMSKGIFQFDMWPEFSWKDNAPRYDWEDLRENVMKHGIRNSLLLAPMPTASTSQILGANECFEPFTSNLYKRKTLAGEFVIINKYLVKELMDHGLWDKSMREQLMLSEGSVQNIARVPQEIKDLFKTVWELSMKTIIDHAATRAPFICQSQSMNLFVENPTFQKLSSMHFYAWSKGLKTGMYYLRSKSKAKTQSFTIDPKVSRFTNQKNVECNDEVCVMCSS